MNHENNAEQSLRTQELALAASNMKHYLKLPDNGPPIEDLVFSLEQSIADAHANNPIDFNDMLATQARLLDAGFHFMLDKAKDPFYAQDFLNMALKAQRQVQRTIMTWGTLKKAQK